MTQPAEMIIHQNQPGFLAPVVTAQNALIAYQAKKDLIDGIMKENVDFGVIPGSKKPSLLKAGAEKATSFFGLFPRFADAEVVNDWTGENHGGEPFFYYRRTCNLYRGDILVASVDGSCNSWEKKYRYRWVDESQVPANVDKSKLKTQGGRVSEFTFAVEKAETTGKYGKPAEYWKRFTDAINNGTATPTKRKTSKGESPAWEIDGTMYCLPNEDPADIVNTVLKMADKRALVAATLIATGLSEYFTQDIEDYVTGEFVTIVAPDSAQKQPAPTSLDALQQHNAEPPRKASPSAKAGQNEDMADELDRDFPPMQNESTQTEPTDDKKKQEFRHAALWNKAGKAKLLTPSNIEVWKRGPGDTAEEIAGRCELMHAALDPTYGSASRLPAGIDASHLDEVESGIDPSDGQPFGAK
jgi:hypothetical protein